MKNVKLKSEGNQFKVYVDDLIHITFIQAEFLGFQSWVKGTDWYCIEFHFNNKGRMLCEYTSKELWESILKEFDKFKF